MPIPKIIHYCWFGPNPMPELELRCIESWKKFAPDYKTMFWNEQTFDIKNSTPYVIQAYKCQKYAFVADYVRIYALITYGGIYLDTDMELLSSIDRFIENDAFAGFEDKTTVATAILGSCKGNPIFQKMFDVYNSTNFLDNNGNQRIITINSVLVNILLSKGFIPINGEQNLKDIHIYERDVFCPKKLKNGVYKITQYSVSIHHFSASWLTLRQKKRGQNFIWIEICRPILRKCRLLLEYIAGKDITENFEIKIRNWLK